MAKTTKSRSARVAAPDPTVIDGAQDYVFSTKPVPRVPCRICGAPGATARSDRLCWVCQHLKISAWRESEAQDSAGD